MPASTTSTTLPNDSVFLSYHTPNREVILKIREQLASRDIPSFLDVINLEYGAHWIEALEIRIKDARAAVILLGPAGLGVWQKREMYLTLHRQAREEKRQRLFRVIPILLPGVERESVSTLLLLNHSISFRAEEPTDAELERLVRALAGEALPEPDPQPPLCPYRGLDAFREEDASLFFGRETFADALLAKVQAFPVVAVVGPSGSGKSSVVQAGLLPRLRLTTEPTWDAVTITPGNRPFHQLAHALSAVLDEGRAISETQRLTDAEALGTKLANKEITSLTPFITSAARQRRVDRLLLVVDQFEELFTLTPPDQQVPFLRLLLAAPHETPACRLVFTLRGDFYNKALETDRDLSEILQQAQVALGPLRPEELRQIITEPARKTGLTLEPGLTESILHDLENQPGQLPLLEYALKELWRECKDGLLTKAAYTAIGGVAGSISKSADAIYDRLKPHQQVACWRLFSRLVRVGTTPEEGDTRRRWPFDALDPEAQAVARLFAAREARLLVLTYDDATRQTLVEVAHEALIRTWGQLTDWLLQERDFLRWRQDLGHDVIQWRQEGHDPSFLYQGKQLKDANRKRKGREADLTSDETAFLRASNGVRPRTRALLIATAGVLVLAVCLWGWIRNYEKGIITYTGWRLTWRSWQDTKQDGTQQAQARRYVLEGNYEQALAQVAECPTDSTKERIFVEILQDSLRLANGLLTPSIVGQTLLVADKQLRDVTFANVLKRVAAAAPHLRDSTQAPALLKRVVDLADNRFQTTSDNLLYVLTSVADAVATPQLRDSPQAPVLLGRVVDLSDKWYPSTSDRLDETPLMFSSESTELVIVLTHIANTTSQLRDSTQARALLHRVVEFAENHFKYESAPLAAVLTRVAVASRLHDATQAYALLDRALYLAKNRFQYGSILKNVAETAVQLRDSTQAYALLDRALYLAADIQNDPDKLKFALEFKADAFADVLTSFAAVAPQLRDSTQASALLRRVVGLAEKHFQNAPERLAVVLTSVAAAWNQLHDSPQGSALLRRVIDLAGNRFRDDDPSKFFTVLDNVVDAASQSHDASQAPDLLRRILGLADHRFQNAPERLADVLKRVAAAAPQLRDSTQAPALLHRVVALAEKRFQNDPGRLAGVLTSVAAAALQLRDATQAPAMLRPVVALAEKRFQNAPERLADVLKRVAAAAPQLRDSTQAPALLHRVVALAEKRFQNAPERLAVVLTNVAADWNQLHDSTQAPALLNRVLDLANNHFQKEPYILKYVLKRVAAAAPQLRDPTLAPDLLRRVVGLAENRFQGDPARLADVLAKVAAGFARLGQWHQASDALATIPSAYVAPEYYVILREWHRQRDAKAHPTQVTASTRRPVAPGARATR